MRAEGKLVSVAQLCRWFSVPRSTFYYRGERRRAPELDRALVELVRRLIGENPDYGLRRLTVQVRAAGSREPQAYPSHSEGERLADPPAAARATAPSARLDVAGRATKHAVGNRCDARLLRPGRVVSPDGDHRLL
jgi:hypothetical protein